MTELRAIKKGDRLLIQALATEDQVVIDPVNTGTDVVRVAIGGYKDLSTLGNPDYVIYVSTIVDIQSPTIKVGDRVKSKLHKSTGVVKAIEGDYFWVIVDGEKSPYTYDNRNLKFEVV